MFAIAAFAAPIGGCNVVAPIAFLVEGPPKTAAQHRLDGAKSYVVFLDDRSNRVPRRALRTSVAQEVEAELIRRKIVPAEQLYPSQAAARVAATETYGEPLSIAQVGSAVGAERVIYVDMTGWRLTTDGVTTEPAATAIVKIVDAATGERVWPGEGAGHPVVFSLRRTGAQLPPNPGARAQIEQGLAAAFGAQIARLFYEHERDSLSGAIGD